MVKNVFFVHFLLCLWGSTGVAMPSEVSIHHAVSVGNMDALHEFLKDSANLNARDETSRTPLHTAATHLRVRAIEHLLRAGADVNARDQSAATPLHLAAFNTSLQIHSWLQSIGLPNDAERYSAAQVASIEVLLQAGASVNAKADDTTTPLHLAVILGRHGHLPAIAALLKHGAYVDARTRPELMTPLHHAVSSGVSRRAVDLPVVEALIKFGAHVNARDAKSRTPLHFAVFDGQVAVVEFLLDNGAEVNAQADLGLTALDMARVAMNRTERSIKPFSDIVQLLKANGGR